MEPDLLNTKQYHNVTQVGDLQKGTVSEGIKEGGSNIRVSREKTYGRRFGKSNTFTPKFQKLLGRPKRENRGMHPNESGLQKRLIKKHPQRWRSLEIWRTRNTNVDIQIK